MWVATLALNPVSSSMDKIGFWQVLIVVFFAELPCLLRTMCIQLHNKGIWGVVWGTIVGSILALVIGILLAKVAQQYSSALLEYLEKCSAGMLVLLGLYLLFSGHDH
jgi:putative Ca2+/H+ antiporter (TMEM165/GDT1 family)